MAVFIQAGYVRVSRITAETLLLVFQMTDNAVALGLTQAARRRRGQGILATYQQISRGGVTTALGALQALLGAEQTKLERYSQAQQDNMRYPG